MLLKHGADVGKENRSGWTGEQVAAALLPSASCPGTDTGMEMDVGMSMGRDVDMDTGMNTGTGMIVSPWCCSPQGAAHVVLRACGTCAVPSSAVPCVPRCAMALDIAPFALQSCRRL